MIHDILKEKAEVVEAVQDGTGGDSTNTGDILGDIVERMRVS